MNRQKGFVNAKKKEKSILNKCSHVKIKNIGVKLSKKTCSHINKDLFSNLFLYLKIKANIKIFSGYPPVNINNST